jgi:hypothetical protein
MLVELWHLRLHQVAVAVAAAAVAKNRRREGILLPPQLLFGLGTLPHFCLAILPHSCRPSMQRLGGNWHTIGWPLQRSLIMGMIAVVAAAAEIDKIKEVINQENGQHPFALKSYKRRKYI